MIPLQRAPVGKFNAAARAGRHFSALPFVVANVMLALAPSAHAQQWPKIELSEAAVGFSGPVHIAHAGDGSGRLFVVELGGRIYAVRPDGTRTVFLDIQGRIGSQYQGALSMAFPPGFQTATNKHFYVNYTDLNSDLVVSRFFVSADANVALSESEQVIIKIPRVAAYGNGPAIFHSGGELAFGPDGFLYFGVGDGDTGTSPGDAQKVAQSLSSLRGKVLRLDVESVSGPGYVIPNTNPFAPRGKVRGEIWAVGVRNPWRSSFDRTSGDFYLGDVGQDKFEEINFQAARTAGGLNYGWSVMEGPEMYNGAVNPPANHTPPIATYIIERTAGDCSVTAGRVYRGPGNPRMQGVYFYGDFCSGKIWGLRRQDGVWATQLVRGSPPESGPVLSREGLVSFGEDELGNLYLTDRIAGKIYKLSDSVTSANNAPTASNQSVSVPEDQQVNVTLSATDPDGDGLEFAIISGPAHGTLSGTGATRVYQPFLNFSGSDTFMFTAFDGTNTSNVAEVAITVTPVNDAPVAAKDSAATIKGIAVVVPVLANDTDADGDSLRITSVGKPTKGTAVPDPAGIRYTPDFSTTGNITFTYTISDDKGGTATGTVTVTVNKK